MVYPMFLMSVGETFIDKDKFINRWSICNMTKKEREKIMKNPTSFINEFRREILCKHLKRKRNTIVSFGTVFSKTVKNKIQNTQW